MIFARLAEANLGARKSPEAIEAFKKLPHSTRANLTTTISSACCTCRPKMAEAATHFDKYLQLAPKAENAAIRNNFRTLQSLQIKTGAAEGNPC
jgi:hypothetical protein